MSVDVLAPGFWEIGAYKNNVRRIKEGIDELDDFTKMVRERVEIEARYGKAMQQFANKWKVHVERTVPSGSIKRAWMEILEEADSISVQHIRVKDRLVDEVLKTLALYRKDNFHPSALRAPKELREAEEGFERAQRKWKKLHEKLEASKKAYYNACRQEKSALVHLNNTQADPALSRDGAKKFRDRLEKCREDVQKCKLFYEKNIEEITHYRTPYIEEMTFEFEKCQAIEMKRSKFIIEMLSATQKVLVDLACDNRFTQLHGNLENVLRSCDESALAADLQAWSALNGKDACTEWPAFEEYTESLRAIAKKGHSNSTATGVILTKQIIKTDDMPGPATVAAPNSDCGKSNDSGTNSMTGVHKNDLHKVKVRSTQQNTDGQQENRGSPPLSIATLDSARYSGYEELRTKCTATVLYNYSPNESDEIPLQKGETIEILSEADSLGWCTGRKNGEVGLLPASYVQEM